MKKWIGLGLFLINTLSFAGTMADSPDLIFNGPYLGVGAGLTRQNVDYEYRQLNFIYSPLLTHSYSSKLDNASYRAILGYGLNMQPLYLGSEFTIGAINGQSKVSPFNFGNASLLREQQKLNLVASFLVGATVSDSTLLYGQAGIGAGEYALTIRDFNNNVVITNRKHTSWAPEMVLGLGVEQIVTDNMSLRLSYIYEKTNRIFGPSAFAVDFPNGTLFNQHQQTYVARDQTLMLDFIWRMDCA